MHGHGAARAPQQTTGRHHRPPAPTCRNLYPATVASASAPTCGATTAQHTPQHAPALALTVIIPHCLARPRPALLPYKMYSNA
eukprot:jgi/Ulvmu1/11812/UM080_0023.1